MTQGPGAGSKVLPLAQQLHTRPEGCGSREGRPGRNLCTLPAPESRGQGPPAPGLLKSCGPGCPLGIGTPTVPCRTRYCNALVPRSEYEAPGESRPWRVRPTPAGCQWESPRKGSQGHRPPTAMPTSALGIGMEDGLTQPGDILLSSPIPISAPCRTLLSSVTCHR